MGKKLVIGICGYRGSGKDAFGSVLRNEIALSGRFPNAEIKIFKFADPLYDIVSKITGDRRRDLINIRSLKSEKLPFPYDKFTRRDFLIQIGESFREIDPDVWVKYQQRAVANSLGFNDTIFIYTDVRKPNEAQFIKDHGGLLIKMVNTSGEESNIPDIGTERPNLLDDYVDYTILNEKKSFDPLRHEAKNVILALQLAWEVDKVKKTP